MKPIKLLNLADYKLLIFDWDDTLVVSTEKYRLLDSNFVKGFYGKNDLEKLYQLEYSPTHKHWKDDYYRNLDIIYGNGKMPLKTIYRHLETYKNDIRANISYQKDADIALKLLRANTKEKMALATNSDTADINFFSSKQATTARSLIPNKFFDKILTIDDIKATKPDPDIYNKMVDHFQIKKSEVLVFEDSERGIFAAQSAGLDTVLVGGGQPPATIQADYHMKKWAELIQLAQNFTSKKAQIYSKDIWMDRRAEVEYFDLTKQTLPDLEWYHVSCLGNLQGKIPLVYYQDYPCGLPGGHVESTDLDIEATLCREVDEEINCHIASWEPIGYQRWTMPDGSVQNRLFVYAYLEKKGNFIKDPGGLVSNYKLHDIAEYPKLTGHGEIGEYIYTCVAHYYHN